jgi:3-deoxy-D-manno-oct-2-ulosonic acid (Kdo) hydroxylase
MNHQIVEVNHPEWTTHIEQDKWVTDLEAGKVLHFTSLEFPVPALEQIFFTSEIRNPKSRNISLEASGNLKGAIGNEEVQAGLGLMIERFRAQAQALVNSYFPYYKNYLSVAPTSFRPMRIETRNQSWRADDKRLHVDAFPSRPNYGERILRVFINVNPDNVARVWRVGEPFETIVNRFIPQAASYSAWRARVLNIAGVTKSFRSEYDHLMLQLHDAMKHDLDYQRNSPQLTVSFPAGSVWACFSDQVSHAAMSGQYMMEQTFHLPVSKQYDTNASPLAILRNFTGRELI